MKRPLALVALLLVAPLAYADCITYTGGLTECSGPGGYQSSQREYTGNMAESWDNRGNRATIHRHTGGYTSVTAPTGVAPSVSAAPSPGYSGGRDGELNTGSRINPYVALKVQYDQTNKQATDEMSVRAREAMIETARLRVLGGESGLAGGSNDRIENESQFNLGTDIASLESNRRNSLTQLQQEGKYLHANNQSRINQIKRPSLIGTGLQIAGAATDSAVMYKSLKAPGSKTLPLS